MTFFIKSLSPKAEQIAGYIHTHWVADNYPVYELHVKEFMIRHRKMLGISDTDARTLQDMILRQM